MRPSTAISADGPINLYSAVILAGSDEAVGKGVLVALNDQINAAREVTKTNTSTADPRPDRFRKSCSASGASSARRGAKVSITIMRPPQRGQGQGSTGGGSVAISGGCCGSSIRRSTSVVRS
jgi:L-asparaginase/Glu-tRNA(Gln) amidotransferase subunit D